MNFVLEAFSVSRLEVVQRDSLTRFLFMAASKSFKDFPDMNNTVSSKKSVKVRDYFNGQFWSLNFFSGDKC